MAYFIQNNHLKLGDAKQNGFTLVEVMIVIVILSLFAGMMTLSIGGSESRNNKAFYEHLQSNINYVRLLSAEQMKPYGLAIKLAKDGNTSQVMVVKLEQNLPANNANQHTTQNSNQNLLPLNSQALPNSPPSWQLDRQVEPLDIPENIDIAIAPLDTVNSPNINTPNWLIGDQAPPVVWFGTGEATPVQISVKAKNGDNIVMVDDPIVINATGAIEVAK